MGQWMNEMVEMLMPYGVISLFVFSFIEASFFPIPPYILFIPMTLAKPNLGLYYALVGTVGSVLGGLFGYVLGYRLGRPFLTKIVKPETMHKIEATYQKYGDWATAAGGVTPLPYKIFAISAGVFRNRLGTFIPASIIARGIRFFGEAVLLMVYGERIRKFLDEAFGPLNLLIIGAIALVVIIIWKAGWFPKTLLNYRRQWKKQWLGWVGHIRTKYFPNRILNWFLLASAALTLVGLLLVFNASFGWF
ncbi:MAG TPA: VTT domain-containing protein [Bacillota bacterium]|nr:VTT domain-containing protein [Bacillota bacterium]